MSMSCTLCGKWVLEKIELEKEYFKCNSCDLIFLNPKKYITPAEEKKRYLEHNNFQSDIRYQNYMKPLVNWVTESFDSPSEGLDYGCGFESVAQFLLTKENIHLKIYDLYFHSDKSILNNKYDFVIASEVIEHFHNPKMEFDLISQITLKSLFIRTEMFDSIIDFKNWYYRKDPTHVCFYSKKTFEWIQSHYRFSNLNYRNKNLIHLSR